MEPSPDRVVPRQIKVPLRVLDKVEARAAAEGLSAADIIVRYATRYANHDIPLPRLTIQYGNNQTADIPEVESGYYDQKRKIRTHQVSFRILLAVWKLAMERAEADESVLSAILNRYLRGYADHIIN